VIGHGGTVQARMARMIQDTWVRINKQIKEAVDKGDLSKGYPNYLYVIDHGSVTISDIPPYSENLPNLLKSAKAVLPCYLPSRAAAAYLCLT